MTLIDLKVNDQVNETSNYYKTSKYPKKEVENRLEKSYEFESPDLSLKIETKEDQKKFEDIIQKAADQMNDIAKTFDRSIRFIIHKDSGKIQTEVIDKDTDKVIREIPSDEVLDMIAKLKSYIGTILDIQS